MKKHYLIKKEVVCTYTSEQTDDSISVVETSDEEEPDISNVIITTKKDFIVIDLRDIPGLIVLLSGILPDDAMSGKDE